MVTSINLPYTQSAAITTSDTVAITKKIHSYEPNLPTVFPDAILIGAAGNVVLVTADGTVNAVVTVVAGQILPISCQRVNATSTTATNLVALWY